MSRNKYQSIRIFMLNKAEYPIWNVKMMMFLEATDCDYLDRIHDGPFFPRQLIPTTLVGGVNQPKHYVVKDKSEWTKEEKTEVLKNAKVRNILYNALDVVMSNRVITSKTTKEIWDALEVQCQETKEIKKNRRFVLTQEYEYFEAKANESLTEIYDRFLTLVNELALVGKEYSNEDSNTKFMRALPEEWDLKTTIIRDNTASLDDVSLDEIQGRLKIHDLDIMQRNNGKPTRTKYVVLNAKANTIERLSSSARRKTKYVESSESQDESNSDGNFDDDSYSDSSYTKMKEMVAMIVKGFKKMKYRKCRKVGNTSKKVSGDSKTGRYKKKDDMENKFGKFDKAKVKCYNCDSMVTLLLST